MDIKNILIKKLCNLGLHMDNITDDLNVVTNLSNVS